MYEVCEYTIFSSCIYSHIYFTSSKQENFKYSEQLNIHENKKKITEQKINIEKLPLSSC